MDNNSSQCFYAFGDSRRVWQAWSPLYGLQLVRAPGSGGTETSSDFVYCKEFFEIDLGKFQQ